MIKVSTLVVEWIEIPVTSITRYAWEVSTLVVEWIEIRIGYLLTAVSIGLHPRGGVD